MTVIPGAESFRMYFLAEGWYSPEDEDSDVEDDYYTEEEERECSRSPLRQVAGAMLSLCIRDYLP